MIAAAGVQDQDLTIGAERPGVDHPAVGGRDDARAGFGRDRQALCLAAQPVVAAEIEPRLAGNRQRQKAARVGEGHGRRDPARVGEPARRVRRVGRRGRGSRSFGGSLGVLNRLYVALQDGDKRFEAARLASEPFRRLALAREIRLGGFPQPALGGDQEIDARPLLAERRVAPLQLFALRSDARAERDQVLQIRGKRLRFDAHDRQDGGGEDRAADGAERVFRPRQEGWRRRAAHSLEGGEHFGEHRPAAAQRGAQSVLAVLKIGEPVFERGDVGFRPAQARGGAQEVGGERRPVGLDRLDLAAQLLLRRLRQFEGPAEGGQLGFPRPLPGFGGTARLRQGVDRRCGRQRGRIRPGGRLVFDGERRGRDARDDGQRQRRARAGERTSRSLPSHAARIANHHRRIMPDDRDVRKGWSWRGRAARRAGCGRARAETSCATATDGGRRAREGGGRDRRRRR